MSEQDATFLQELMYQTQFQENELEKEDDCVSNSNFGSRHSSSTFSTASTRTATSSVLYTDSEASDVTEIQETRTKLFDETHAGKCTVRRLILKKCSSTVTVATFNS